MPPCRIYITDLVHNHAAKGPFMFPLNAGYLAAYAQKRFGRAVETRIFKFPGDFMAAVEEAPPHIAGFGNYTWNLQINRKLAAWLKAKDPNIVTVFGGPDFPIAPKEAREYVISRPMVDFFVLHQGEPGLANLIERYMAAGSPETMKKELLPNCVFKDPGGNEMVGPGEIGFIEDLAEIPSPYLSGVLDPFFTGGLIPLIETNRGCPYRCTYCAWGAAAQRKVYQFPLERVEEELDYIAAQPKNAGLLMVGDANFGIFARDVEIARHLRNIKDRTGYPSYVEIAWAKKTPDRIQEMAELLKDMASVTCSFQTLDPTVMANIQRTNLSFEQFKKIQAHFFAQGVPSHTELILALPDESRETHLDGLRKMFDTDIWFIECYNLRMLDGSALATRESRQKYGQETKYRLVDGGFGQYGDIKAIEHEEMVIRTDTMSMEDVMFFRPIHFLIYFLWNYRYYAELLILLRGFGLNPADFLVRLVEDGVEEPGPVGKVFREYRDEAWGEWFDTPEELRAHYGQEDEFQKISAGGFGKLNYKYMWRFLLECRADWDAYLLATARRMLAADGEIEPEREAQLEAVMAYLAGLFVDFSQGPEGIERERRLELDYDILAWKQGACQKPLAQYARPVKLRFYLSEAQHQTLTSLFAQFRQPSLNQTLRKMVEYMNKRDLLYKVEHA